VPTLRTLVSTTDPSLRHTVTSAFEEVGCEVLTAASGVECVEKARDASPDLLVLLPPLLWGSVAGVLAVLHEDPRTSRVPVLILSQPINEGPFPRTPRLFLADQTGGTDALPSLVERVCARVRKFSAAARAGKV
jgi:CheY-like chemotaxis protein